MMKQLRKNLRLLGAVVGAALLLVAGTYNGAAAAPLTFIWDPAAVGLVAGSVIGPANNFNVADFADIRITGPTFTEIGYLTVTQFLNGGVGPPTTPQTGLSTTYSLYFGFNGTGSGVAIPPPGNSVTGPFGSLDYTLYAKPGTPPTLTVSPGGVAIAGNAGAFPLAFGSMIPGGGLFTLTNTGSGFSPTANLLETFHVCTAAGQGNAGFGQALCTGNESAFFASPLPVGTINLVVGNFSATTSVTTLGPCGSDSCLDINGGGGNLTLEHRVPEPMSLLLLGVGCLGLAGLSRMRRVKR